MQTVTIKGGGYFDELGGHWRDKRTALSPTITMNPRQRHSKPPESSSTFNIFRVPQSSRVYLTHLEPGRTTLSILKLNPLSAAGPFNGLFTRSPGRDNASCSASSVLGAYRHRLSIMALAVAPRVFHHVMKITCMLGSIS